MITPPDNEPSTLSRDSAGHAHVRKKAAGRGSRPQLWHSYSRPNLVAYVPSDDEAKY